MYRIWEKKSQEEIKTRVFAALDKNVNYGVEHVLGIPASYLDDKVFSQDEFFLKDAPFISALVQNPNHIGCHTRGTSEHYFRGTQEIEKELIEVCAVDILKGKLGQQDGYVASGGTEANMQAIWVYRNYFIQRYQARLEDIAIMCSVDSHYSMDKASNIFVLDIYKVAVDRQTREISMDSVADTLHKARTDGKKYFIIVCNMMTTMYGSVDNIYTYTDVLKNSDCPFKVHVDGAYGGFYYPFTEHNSLLTFQNEHITSFTLDAHKMAQAPYGTGIFLIRKGFIEYVSTKEAGYIEGEDCTLIGSRSGANAVAVWMILMKNGPYGWIEKMFILQQRTEWMCKQLNELDISYYRHPKSNIITIDSKCISTEIAKEFGLVPDKHSNPSWYKIVLMDHVSIEKLLLLVNALKEH
ncbi:MAG: pyridoxal-dependent decarboxylase [Saprospiraceae bacterium]